MWASFVPLSHPHQGSPVLTSSLCVPPGECLVTGQSHFKSFDNRYFTFSGVCQYLLAQDCQDHTFSVVIETVQVSWPVALQEAVMEGEGQGGSVSEWLWYTLSLFSPGIGARRANLEGTWLLLRTDVPDLLWNHRPK